MKLKPIDYLSIIYFLLISFLTGLYVGKYIPNKKIIRIFFHTIAKFPDGKWRRAERMYTIIASCGGLGYLVFNKNIFWQQAFLPVPKKSYFYLDKMA